MVKLDKFDLKLLGGLEKDAHQTLSKIAKKLKTSQQVISYRIKSLENKNIIGGYYTIINLTKLGYTSYRTMIRFTNIHEKKHKEIFEYLMRSQNILWLVDCGGRWDLIINFIAKNIVHYNYLLRKFKNKFPSQIQNYDVLTTLEGIYFGRDYILGIKNRTRKSPSFIGEWEVLKLDKKDLQILNLLSEKARMNSVDIATKIRLSPNTVISRIKSLIKKEIIQGFKPLIHLENTPYSEYKALIKFHNITEEKEKEIIGDLKSHLNVVGVIRLIGLWDFEIEFQADTKEDMLKFTRIFRDKFKEVIKEFEVIPLFHEHKYNFFPKDLLLEN